MLWPPPFPSAPLPLLPQVREPLPGRYSLEDVNGQQADVVAGPAEATRYGCGAAVYVVDKVWGGVLQWGGTAAYALVYVVDQVGAGFRV